MLFGTCYSATVKMVVARSLRISKASIIFCRPTPVLFDAEGRTVDHSGKALQIPQRQPTIMANIRAKKKEHFEKVSRKTVGKTEDESSPFFDPRLR